MVIRIMAKVPKRSWISIFLIFCRVIVFILILIFVCQLLRAISGPERLVCAYLNFSCNYKDLRAGVSAWHSRTFVHLFVNLAKSVSR